MRCTRFILSNLSAAAAAKCRVTPPEKGLKFERLTGPRRSMGWGLFDWASRGHLSLGPFQNERFSGGGASPKLLRNLRLACLKVAHREAPALKEFMGVASGKEEITPFQAIATCKVRYVPRGPFVAWMQPSQEPFVARPSRVPCKRRMCLSKGKGAATRFPSSALLPFFGGGFPY